MSELPAKTELLYTLSKDLKQWVINFVGPAIAYAFLQVVATVNDHTVNCFRYKEVSLVNLTYFS